MHRFRNVALIVIFALFVCGPFALGAAQSMGTDLPSWLTYREADRLMGYHESADIAENLNADGFANRELQNAIDVELGNTIPAKASAMLANAALQRSTIALANVPFGWDCYPTYFDSERIYIPSANAVAYRPPKQNPSETGKLDAFARSVAQVAQDFPEKRFIIYAVGGLNTPAVCPAIDLINDCYTPKVIHDIMQNAVAEVGADNVTVMYDDYEGASLDEYYTYFWRTDHHWNPLGAARAYNAMAAHMGNPPFEAGNLVPAVDGPFIGRTAMLSLCPLSELPLDLDNDFSNLLMTSFEGDRTFLEPEHPDYWGLDPVDRPYEFNGWWMNSQLTSRIDGPGTGTALLVSDSFGSGVQRFIGTQYATTYVPWHMFHYEYGDDRLIDLLEGVDDIYLVADYRDFENLPAHFPHYFDRD